MGHVIGGDALHLVLSCPVNELQVEILRQTWFRLPDMPHGHVMPMCESVFSEERGVELVIAGGWDSGGGVAHAKVDVFNLKDWKWRAGPDLPLTISLGATISHEKSFLLIGGFIDADNDSPNIYRFSISLNDVK